MRSATTENGGTLNVLASRKDGYAAELAVANPFVAILQRLDALAELFADYLKLREDMRRPTDLFGAIGDDSHWKQHRRGQPVSNLNKRMTLAVAE